MRNFREIHQDPTGEGSIERILELVDTCYDEHELCRRDENRRFSFPLRLVNVGDAQDAPKLQDSDKDNVYIALSHCWGKEQPYTTTTSTLSSRLKALDWDALPRTFLDAIKVARTVGVKYIWIDSICIVQDDP
jgi:hypothetical protein